MTAAQQQHLLAYLGFDPGAVDGVIGSKTKKAAADFQSAAGMTPSGKIDSETETALKRAVWEGLPQSRAEDFWADIRYFRREEFRCPCPRCGGFPAEPKEKLIRAADRIRQLAGKPAIVSSGVRCAAHNRELNGSVPNSRHLTGNAMDFCVRGMSASQLLALVRQQPEIAYSYAIDDSFVHMDVV